MITVLPRVVPAEAGKPVRDGVSTIQRESAAIAENPSSWSAGNARQVIEQYRQLAPLWDDERGRYRRIPLADALARGGPLPDGWCAELGCGTGLLTPLLTQVWSRVAGLDLSWDMLHRSAAPARILADASRTPLLAARVAAIVLADVPLFAPEMVRILAPHGVVIWSNALGRDAPHHVPVETVRSSLARASGTRWSAVTAEAGWGLWAVLRPA